MRQRALVMARNEGSDIAMDCKNTAPPLHIYMRVDNDHRSECRSIEEIERVDNG